jgi:hypothetical protein
MSVTISQDDAILAILHTRPEGITPLDALREVGCMRLAARIAELRARGEDIQTVPETVNGRTFARYRLAPKVTSWPAIPETEQRALWGDR